MNERLNKWVNVHEMFQTGFRKAYSTADNIFCLFNIVRMKWYDRFGKVYCFFVDFDRVNREALFYKLSQKGVSSKFLNVL